MTSKPIPGRRLRLWLCALLTVAACVADPSGVNESVARTDALFAKALSLTSVRLSWPVSDDVDVLQYLIERRANLEGEFEQVAQVGQVTADSVLYFDNTVEPETFYGYRVIAVDRFGTRSAPSIVAGVQTPPKPGIEVRVATRASSSGFTDPDGYLATVLGPDTTSGTIGVGAEGTVVSRRFSPLRAGSYKVKLTGLAANCEFTGQGGGQTDTMTTLPVTDQGTATVSAAFWDIGCRDPSRGEIVTIVEVTGGDVDSSGYSIVVSGQASDQSLPDSSRIYLSRRPIATPSGGSLVFDNLRVGSYQAEIDSVAASCRVKTARNVPVGVTPLGRDTVKFVVDCPLGEIPDVPDPARPYVVRNSWNVASAPKGSTVRLDVKTDFAKALTVLDMGAVTGFDRTVVRIDSLVGAPAWSTTPNIGVPGLAAWLLVNPQAPSITRADLVSIWFTVVGDSGANVRTSTIVSGLSDANGDPKQDSVRVVEARFTVGGSGGGGGGNLPPVAEANGPYTATAGAPVTVSAAGSTDPDGTIASYAWNWGDGSATGTGASASHTYAAAGTFTVTLTVTDNQGATDTDPATVTVTSGGPTNQPPVAEANGPYSGQSGSAITFSAAGSSDPDGTITSYEWTFGDNTGGTGASVGKIYTSPGTYTVTLTVRDNGGLTATDQAQVTVSAPPPTGPLFWRNTFGGITPADSLVQLTITYDITADVPETPSTTEAVGTVVIDSLKWNPALLQYVAFNWGPGFSGSVNSTGASASGRLRFSGALGTNGASRVVPIATITFKAVGPAGNNVLTSTFLGGISSSISTGAVSYLAKTGVVEGTLNLSYTGTQQTGTVSGSVNVTGQATSLAGVGFTIDPTATGAATVTGTLTGSGTTFAIPARQVQLGVTGDPSFGAGTVTLGALPSGCSVTAPAGGSASYSGVAAGGSTTVSFTVNCQAAPPPVQRYVFKSTWGTVSNNTVDLTLSFDPTGFNDPAINGAGADGFAGYGAVTTLTGSAASRLTAVSGVAASPFGAPTIGGTLPVVTHLATKTGADVSALANIAVLRFTIGAGAAGTVTTATTGIEVSTSLGDTFNLVFSGASQNIDVVEGTLNLP